MVMTMTRLPPAVLLLIVMLQLTQEQGLPGPPGDTGSTGATGQRGQTGSTGATGPPGLPGPPGSPGSPGPGAAGPPGQPGSWGPTGPPGLPGPGGTSGSTGTAGADGSTGSTGATGEINPSLTTDYPCLSGPVGPPGPFGATGHAGATGATGFDGSAGQTGRRGPTGATGEPGGQGPRGPRGTTGATGSSGFTGPPGATGFAGSPGRVGATGATGATGIRVQVINRRVVRQAGCRGPKGPPGASGFTGASGQPGGSGATGPPGWSGPVGSTGATGSAGSPGPGPAGPPGWPGVRGASGGPGRPGSTGFTGISGPTGLQGATGIIRFDVEPVILSVLTIHDVRPLYGPIAGGTRVTITGEFHSQSVFNSVYFGPHRGISDTPSFENNTFYVLTSPVKAPERNLAIVVILSNGTQVCTGHKFEYRADPIITNITPRKHLTIGGTVVTVHGSHLDSVAEPRITLTVVITRSINGGTLPYRRRRQLNDDGDSILYPINTDSQPCIPETNENSTTMLCRMPRLFLPTNLSEQLENSESGTIDNPAGPGVAVYLASDRRSRADIYAGLKMDGVRLYENISTVYPLIKMQFALAPVISCHSTSNELEYVPSGDKVIAIEGRRLQRVSLENYHITLGDDVCVPVSLADNQLDCRPPMEKPNKNINDTFCQDTLSLLVTVGNAYYQCCVRYVENIPLIIALSVVFGLLIIIIIVVIIIVIVRYVRRQGKQRAPAGESRDDGAETSTERRNQDVNYSRRPPDDYSNRYSDDYNRRLPDNYIRDNDL